MTTSEGLIKDLHEDLGSAFHDLLREEDDVRVCTYRDGRGGKTIETLSGTEAACDFERLYRSASIKDVELHEGGSDPRYDVVLKAQTAEAARSYLESKDDPRHSPEGIEELWVRYTSDLPED